MKWCKASILNFHVKKNATDQQKYNFPMERWGQETKAVGT